MSKMGKPFNEEWAAFDKTMKRESDDEHPIAEFDYRDGWDTERAQLASAAPDMVKLLLEVEWSEIEPSGDIARCPWCWALEQDGEHLPGCDYFAALKKAGL